MLSYCSSVKNTENINPKDSKTNNGKIMLLSKSGTFTNNEERIQRFEETGDTKYIGRNGLDKACFQHDMVYGDFKDS